MQRNAIEERKKKRLKQQNKKTTTYNYRFKLFYVNSSLNRDLLG